MSESEEALGPVTDYSEMGVDRTLIRWMLSLTPSERLDMLQRHVNLIAALGGRPKVVPSLGMILDVLIDHEVDFIIVGGLSAAFHGVPVGQLNVEIVHSRTAENLARLYTALRALHAQFRGQPRKVTPTLAHLSSDEPLLFATSAGALDVLGTVGDGSGYDDLLSDAYSVRVAHQKYGRVLGLEKLIDVIKKSGRPKDELMLLTLRETLAERQRQTGQGPAE